MTPAQSIAGFPFYRLEFGTSGQPLCTPELDRLIAESKRSRVTDLLVLAHGFRTDADEATALYTGILTTLRDNFSRAEFSSPSAGRTFAVAGVYWPSQKFRESFGNDGSDGGAAVHQVLGGLRAHCATAERAAAIDCAQGLLTAAKTSRGAQDRFVASVLSAFDDGRDDPAEGLPLLHAWRGSDLLDRLRTPLVQPGTRDEGGIAVLPVLDPVLGGIDRFLNFMSWTAMKNLSGEAGANGLALSLLACRRELENIRFHLIGHSLGGRLVTACCKRLAQEKARSVDSLSLLEAAFSHYGFSPDAGSGERGFFREVIAGGIVGGPAISTFSRNDAVVGTAYALASRLARDRLQAIGDMSDPYGGIGHNGAQRTPEAIAIPLHRAGEPYRFRSGIVTCLDGSRGLIAGHGDVMNGHVTYAIASAICETA